MKIINSLAPRIADTARSGLVKLGQKVQNSQTFAAKANRFTEGRGVNCARGAFLALVYSCTLIPRFLKARDNDERAEILRRDITTLFTICFAMKAIKAGACSLMAKKSGLPLTFTNIPENANKLKKFIGFFQEKGTTAFSAEDITANYANIDGKDTITRFLNFVDKNNGNVGKVLTFDKAKPAGLFTKATEDGALIRAAKKLLGEDFDFTQSGREIIEAVQSKDAANDAFKDISEALKDTKSNPISKFAKGVGGIFETFSFATVIALLGFGLPKMNEKLTKDKYFHGDGALKSTYENPNTKMPYRPSTVGAMNSLDNQQRMVFQNFLGAYKK